MKRSIFVLFVLISVQLDASWSPFGPEGIHANRIRFYLDNNNHWGICHDDGLYLYDLVAQTWTNHTDGLAVIDASYLDGQKILVIMGDGTDSDGIYHFNPVSGQFELIEVIDCPRFICYYEPQQTYYVGHQHGLLTSADGNTWIPVDTFTSKAIVSMDTYETHCAVTEMDNLYGIWYSDDAGVTWSLSPGSPMISDLGFDQGGILYGVFPDGSYSSGLWSSADFGQTWEVEFWSLELSCVGFDYTNVFVGWGASATPPQQGIAWFHPLTGDLTFINSNLPDLTINQITHNPAMSAIALFCCTENGAYVSYDYYLGLRESPEAAVSTLSIHPNPTMTQTVLNFQPPRNPGQGTLTLVDMTGNKVRQTQTDLSTGEITLDCSGLIPGIYIIEIKSSEFVLSGKLLVHQFSKN